MFAKAFLSAWNPTTSKSCLRSLGRYRPTMIAKAEAKPWFSIPKISVGRRVIPKVSHEDFVAGISFLRQLNSRGEFVTWPIQYQSLQPGESRVCVPQLLPYATIIVMAQDSPKADYVILMCGPRRHDSALGHGPHRDYFLFGSVLSWNIRVLDPQARTTTCL